MDSVLIIGIFRRVQVPPCCDRDLKQLPRSHTLFRRSTLFDIQVRRCRSVMGFLVFGNPTFTLHTKKGAININEYLRLRSCIHTALCSHACTYYACKIFLGQWIKMTLRTYFVHLYTLLSIQTQPGFKIYCIGLFRVLLQLWFPSILGVLGRRPHP